MTTDFIQQLQDDVWGILTNDTGFECVPVYRARTPLEKDADGAPIVGQSAMIEEEIEQTLGGLTMKNGKCGIVAIVMLPDVKAESAETRGPALELTVIVRVIEDRLLNEGLTGTGITSSQLALHTVQVLHRRSLRGMHTLRVDPQSMLEEVPLPGDRKAHEVRLVLSRGMAPLPKCARPAGTLVEGTLTLTCAEEAAAIYWTQDDSWPGPQNPQAAFYSGPVDVHEATRIRAVAYAGQMQPSDDVCIAGDE